MLSFIIVALSRPAYFAPVFFVWLALYGWWVRTLPPHLARSTGTGALVIGTLSGFPEFVPIFREALESNSLESWLFGATLGVSLFLVFGSMGGFLAYAWGRRKEKDGLWARLGRGALAALAFAIVMVPCFRLSMEFLRNWEYERISRLELSPARAKSLYAELMADRDNRFYVFALIANPSFPESLQMELAGRNSLTDTALLERRNLSLAVARKIAEKSKTKRNRALARIGWMEEEEAAKAVREGGAPRSPAGNSLPGDRSSLAPRSPASR